MNVWNISKSKCIAYFISNEFNIEHTMHTVNVLHSWEPPPHGWITLNIDGSSN